MAEPVVLYGRLVLARVRSQLQYRVSFALDTLAMFLVSFLDFLGVLLIFHATPSLGAFSVEEVAFLYATSGLSFAIAELVVGHLDGFPQLIRDGSFDVVLLRPRGTLFQVVSADFQLRRLGLALQSFVVLGWAIARLDIDWDAGRVAATGLMVVCGAAIFCGVWVLTISVVFWAVEGREAANAFTYGGRWLTQYPVDVYGRWLRRLFAYAIPMAFVSYYPSLYVLDKPDPLGLPHWLRFAAPAAAAGICVVAALTWRTAVRHYRSAGG